ncbi:MAG TPA: CHAT domain-containing protein, partial [Archangium sp.]|nr:CHAT domain-containing protein [Archangium sp.]
TFSFSTNLILNEAHQQPLDSPIKMGKNNRQRRKLKQQPKQQAKHHHRPLFKSAFCELFNAYGDTSQDFWNHHIDLKDEDTVRAFLAWLQTLQETIQTKSIRALDIASRMALTGLLRLRKLKLRPAELLMLDFIQLWLAVHPISQGVQSRMMITTHDWIIYSLSDEIVDTSTGAPVEVDFQIHRLTDLTQASGRISRLGAHQTLLEWLRAFLYYSRIRGVLHDILLPTLPALLPWLTRQLPDIEAIRTTLQLLPWLEVHAPQYAPGLALLIEHLLSNQHIPRASRKDISIALSVRAGSLTKVPRAQRAQQTLADFNDLLRGHERLQLLVASTDNSPENITAALSQLLSAIEEHHRFIEQRGSLRRSWRAIYARGPMFDVIAPLFIPLLERGHTLVAQQLLAAWEGRFEKRRMNPPLFVVPNHPDGTLYAVEGSASRPTNESISLHELTGLSNQFLGRLVVNTNLPNFELQATPRGHHFVSRSHALEFASASEARLDTARMAQWLNTIASKPQAMVVVPGVPYPTQALILRASGWTAPWSISLEEPAEDRKLRSALIWCTGTNYSQMESNAVTHALSTAGIKVEVVPDNEMTEQRFLDAYASNNYDLIWLGSHGEFPPYAPHEASIMLKDGLFLSQERLSSIPPPEQGRRLLILNLCDGATTATLGGMPEMGVAAATCGRHQAVISHLWATEGLPSAIAGALLAIGLASTQSFFGGYEFALKALLAGKTNIRESLEQGLGKDNELLVRLDRSGMDYPNPADWGSLAFYE